MHTIEIDARLLEIFRNKTVKMIKNANEEEDTFSNE